MSDKPRDEKPRKAAAPPAGAKPGRDARPAAGTKGVVIDLEEYRRRRGR